MTKRNVKKQIYMYNWKSGCIRERNFLGPKTLFYLDIFCITKCTPYHVLYKILLCCVVKNKHKVKVKNLKSVSNKNWPLSNIHTQSKLNYVQEPFIYRKVGSMLHLHWYLKCPSISIFNKLLFFVYMLRDRNKFFFLFFYYAQNSITLCTFLYFINSMFLIIVTKRSYIKVRRTIKRFHKLHVRLIGNGIKYDKHCK